MSNDLIFRDKIGENTVAVVFIFDDYSSRDFKKDLEYIKNYQSKTNVPKDPEERKKSLDLKFYQGVDFEKVTFEYFKNSLSAFAKFFFYMIKSNTKLITSSEFNLQFRLKRVPDGEYYFSYGEKGFISDSENACFFAAGMWFINNITLPAIIGRGDYRIVERYFLHELVHHHDKINKNDGMNKEINGVIEYYDKKINNISKRVRKFYSKRSAHFLNCLYTSLFNLREEGLADFNARKENSMDMNIIASRTYYSNLVKLSNMKDRTIPEEFYYKEISTGNLTLTGEYACGRNMCLTIAMATSKQMNKPFIIIIDKNRFSSNDMNINDALNTRKTIYLTGIDNNVITQAIHKIQPAGHYNFVKLYEESCNILGISEDNRIITRRKFYNIIHEAINRLNEEKKNRLKKEGFRYLESDIKEL